MPSEFPEPAIERFFRPFRIITFTVDADERRLIFSSNIDGRVNLWALDVERRFPYPLTTVGQACGNVIVDPNGRYVLASFDNDGDENWQIYALPPEGGELLPIRHVPGEQFFLSDVSDDGRYVYYTASTGNPTFLNVYRYDLKNGVEELLYEGSDGTTLLAAVAPADDAFVTVVSHADTISFMYLHRDGRRIPLRRTDEPHGATAAVFLDGDTVYFLTDEGEDVHYLARYDGATGELTPAARLDGQSMTGLFIHRQSGALYVVAMDGVVDRLQRQRPDEH